MKYSIVILASVLLFTACAVTEQRPSPAVLNDEKIKSTINVMVSILPQVDFVERIGGEKVSVSEMIPPGFSPATYDPSPEQLRKLQAADLYFRIGHIPFEKSHMGRLQTINPTMRIIDTSEGIVLLTLAAHSHDDEEHEDNQHEEGDDPHVWLSPELAKIQAKHIYRALAELSPGDEAFFRQNYEQLLADLDDLNQKLQAAFVLMQGQTILVFHPAFGYLAAAYGFRQEAIQIDGKDPTPAQLKEIIDEAKKDGVKIVFVQAQFSTKSAEAVAQEIGGAVVQIDPLAKDYFSNLENMAQIIIRSSRAQ